MPLQRYREIRAFTESLAAPLDPEDMCIQSMPDASPTKWHLAHTTWFFETFVLEPFCRGHAPFDAGFRTLFNSYYETVGPQHPRAARGLISRPNVARVLEYRRWVDERVARLLEERGDDPELAAVLEIGLQHEQQHQELILTDIKHALSCNPLRPAYREASRPAGPPREPVPARWIEHAGGIVEIGDAGDGFAFDNEGPRHQVLLRPFALASRLVTNAEFLEFVESGAYARPDLWLSAGWAVIQARGWRAPAYWERGEDGWRVFSLEGMQPLELDAPVCHVSFYEADAFARWRGERLPTEAEWETLARGDGRGDGRALLQAMGEVWQWTASPYVGYPGYRPPAGAIGEYNGKFMSDQWVLRGGSCASAAGHVRVTYRNFFPADARWQFSGIRLAREDAS